VAQPSTRILDNVQETPTRLALQKNYPEITGNWFLEHHIPPLAKNSHSTYTHRTNSRTVQIETTIPRETTPYPLSMRQSRIRLLLAKPCHPVPFKNLSHFDHWLAQRVCSETWTGWIFVRFASGMEGLGIWILVAVVVAVVGPRKVMGWGWLSRFGWCEMGCRMGFGGEVGGGGGGFHGIGFHSCVVNIVCRMLLGGLISATQAEVGRRAGRRNCTGC
jgi:hypothetical protein